MKTLFTSFLFFVITSFSIAQGSLDSGLVAYFPFNGNAIDVTGNGYDGTINGNATLVPDRFNSPDRAFTFPDQSSSISLANSISLNLETGFTINTWVKYKLNSSLRIIVSKHVCGFVNGFIFGIDTDGQIVLFLGQSGWSIVRTNQTFVEDQWYMVTATYDATSNIGKVYIDGQLGGNGSVAYNNFSSNPISIGEAYQNNCAAANMNGAVDEVRIYNRVLDTLEIIQLYDDSAPVVVQSVYPNQNSSYFLPNETIKIFFDETLDPTTINSSSVFVKGSLTGRYTIDPIYNSGNNSIEITPASPFKVGEEVTVSITNEILNTSGVMIKPYVFSFKVKPYKGSAKFVVADSLQLSFPPLQVTSADLNNDGLIDVVASNYDSSKVQISLNNGNGNFSPSQLIEGLFKPMHCALSDIDNDGDVDMVIPTNEQNKIQIYKNDGTGLFTNYSEININFPVAVCLGDFDGGGNTDFVAMTNFGYADSRAFIFKNDGQGNFTESGYESISAPVALRNIVGDIDNDGDLDIIGGTSDYSARYKQLINDGNGNFTFTAGPFWGPYPDELVGADFEGDYDLDFVKADYYQSGIQIATNNGDGTFDLLNLGNVGGQSRNPVANDFDADGDQDFVVVFNKFSSSSVGIVKNNVHPNYGFYLNSPIPGLKGLTAADFDNNGSVDLVGISSTTNQIKFLKNCVDSLVAYYPFDNNTKDFSGNINDGTNYNGIFSKDRYGNDNSSIYFDGVDSYVEGINPGNNLPIGNSPRSFTAWIKNNQYNQYGSNIFHYGTAQSAPTNFHFLLTDVLGLGNGYGFGVVYGNTNLNDSTWHFVTGVYEGGTERITKLYVDGKLDISSNISTEPNTSLGTKWRIGRFMEGGTNFNGNIDELKVYDIPLTDQQIRDMYKTTTTAPNLLSPANDSTLINPHSLLIDWDSLTTASSYRFVISNDSLFNSSILDTLIQTSSFDFYNWPFVFNSNLYWKVRTINDGGIGPWSEINRFSIILTDVEDETQLPTEFALLQNYPNPFNPSTSIQYAIASSQFVQLKVYDVLGNEITTLVNEEKPAGVYDVEFNGSGLSSGVYFYQLKANQFVETKKLTLLK